MIFAQFLTTNLKGETVSALGSDGVRYLDGRKSINNLLEDAIQCGQMRNKNLNKGFVGVQIWKGPMFSPYRMLAQKMF